MPIQQSSNFRHFKHIGAFTRMRFCCRHEEQLCNKVVLHSLPDWLLLPHPSLYIKATKGKFYHPHSKSLLNGKTELLCKKSNPGPSAA